MDEDLERLLSNPFEAPRVSPAAAPVLDRAAPGAEQELRLAQDYSIFQAAPEQVLSAHIATARDVEQRILNAPPDSRLRQLIEPHSERFRVNLDELRKAHHSYVETVRDELLTREAERLKRRYFQEDALPAQIDFIKLKRTYEKLRTFNEFAKKDWLEIQKAVDALGVMTESRGAVSIVAENSLSPIQLLLRRTDAFLDALKGYLAIEEETVDTVSGAYRAIASYRPDVRYTLRGFFGLDAPLPSAPARTQADERAEREQREAAAAPRSLVLDGPPTERNRAGVYRTRILGSRDWNRTPHYSLQIPVAYVEQGLESFKTAYQVNVDPQQARGPLSAAAAVVRRGEGAKVLDRYVAMIVGSLDDCAAAITSEDFPGLEKPEVFLYHCGPNVLYSILVGHLRRNSLGEIFYLDAQGNPAQGLPDELIRKTLIEWWNQRFGNLNVEDVDSYLTYSRAIEMVKKEYRALYEEGARLRREEQPGATYVGFDRWIKQNRVRVFGHRKTEIFRRFLGGTIVL